MSISKQFVFAVAILVLLVVASGVSLSYAQACPSARTFEPRLFSTQPAALLTTKTFTGTGWIAGNIVFTRTGSLNIARGGHTATGLSGGRVLIAAGTGNGLFPTTAELYDPGTGGFTTTGSLAQYRYNHTATALSDGKVLIAGGYDNSEPFSRSAEVYDPATGVFSTTGSLSVGRDRHTATRLQNGQVLVAGGRGGADTIIAELYDPATGSFSPTGQLNVARDL